MTDLFSLLGQRRTPWLEADAVREAFVLAAAEVHPDRVHGSSADVRSAAQEQYTRLNEAQRCLTRPHSRLRHLLELERGKPVRDLQEIPDDLMDLFGRLSDQLRVADRHCRESARTTSPLIKVDLFARGEEIRGNLEETLRVLNNRTHELETELRSLGERWEGLQGDPAPERDGLLSELEAVYRFMSFHERWRDQVQSRLAQLMEQGL